MAELSLLMEAVLQEGGSVELTVTGNSMYPMLIHRKSRVRLAPVVDLNVGVLPLYRRDNGKFVLHRIVAMENDRYTCCGDNQWVLEKHLRQDQFLAVVTHFRRRNRWVSTQTLGYGVYWKFWLAILPVRKFAMRAMGWFKRHLRKS